MKPRITVTILLLAVSAANARADGFSPWIRPVQQVATPASPPAAVPPTGFAPWATPARPPRGHAAFAGAAQRTRFHGFGPWIGTRV